MAYVALAAKIVSLSEEGESGGGVESGEMAAKLAKAWRLNRGGVNQRGIS